jgi:hypothetical protein
MRRKHQFFLNLGLAAILLFTVTAVGAQPTEPYPYGEITIEAKQVAAGIGWTWGGGTLKFKGENYKFDIKGLNVAAVGLSKISAKGEAYNLKDASDLVGTYVTASAGLAVIKGKAGLVMRNEKGVVINLIADQKGAQLSLGTDGLKITMK